MSKRADGRIGLVVALVIAILGLVGDLLLVSVSSFALHGGRLLAVLASGFIMGVWVAVVVLVGWLAWDALHVLRSK